MSDFEVKIDDNISECVKHFFVRQFNNENSDIIFNNLRKIISNINLKDCDIFSKDIYKLNNVNDYIMYLAKINEKTINRKKRGVFYTPMDVAEYIISNTFVNNIVKDLDYVSNYNDNISTLLSCDKNTIENFLFSKKVLDPTSGTGEFLLAAFNLKCNVYEQFFDVKKEEDYLKILSTCYANDISEQSIEISIIRFIFLLTTKVKEINNLIKCMKIMKRNFTTNDFVNINDELFDSFDFIVGNPPYVETSKIDYEPMIKYGNIYANVLHNTVHHLSKDGCFGFIIPLSYVATPRMSSIRNYLFHFVDKQFVLNYADRPDCLFDGVHQKLTILIGVKNSRNRGIYTSGYNYWYENERKSLLNGCELVLNTHRIDSFIPKICNQLEEQIFSKIYTNDGETISNLSNSEYENKIYLNMRATFWIKAFSFNPGSNEYKSYGYKEEDLYYILCILNSSLFFFYWNVMSDCWHITSKELSSFSVIYKNVNYDKFKELFIILEDKLEKTKVFVNTKQVDYVYKHKDCIDVINLIDDELAKLYDLSKEQLDYIKKYKLKYRIGSGN